VLCNRARERRLYEAGWKDRSDAAPAAHAATSYKPPVHMIKLTETREITPYTWVHPDEER